MNSLRCVVFRGLPKEIEEELNKFLEATPCQIQHVLQSESVDHVTVTIFYELDLPVDGIEGP
jgi:hypothetical protein